MRLGPLFGFGVLRDSVGLDWDRDWVGLDRGLCRRSFRGLFMGLSFLLWGHGVPIFSLFFLFSFVIGGSGVLSHGAVFGPCFLFLFSFLFFVDMGTFS